AGPGAGCAEVEAAAGGAGAAGDGGRECAGECDREHGDHRGESTHGEGFEQRRCHALPWAKRPATTPTCIARHDRAAAPRDGRYPCRSGHRCRRMRPVMKARLLLVAVLLSCSRNPPPPPPAAPLAAAPAPAASAPEPAAVADVGSPRPASGAAASSARP